MELDQVEVVGREPLQAALDAFVERLRAPVRACPATAVPAFGEEIELTPARGDGFADQLLAVLVAFRGVDDVEPGIQCAAEQLRHRPHVHFLIADL